MQRISPPRSYFCSSTAIVARCRSTSVLETTLISNLAHIVADVVGYDGRIGWDSSKPDGSPRKALDVTRLKNLGWSSKITLDEGVRSTVEWFRETAALFADNSLSDKSVKAEYQTAGTSGLAGSSKWPSFLRKSPRVTRTPSHRSDEQPESDCIGEANKHVVVRPIRREGSTTSPCRDS